MRKQWTSVLVIALALIVVIFSVLNVDPVAINFGFRVIEMPLAVVLIGTLLIGVLMAVMLSTTVIVRNKNEQKKLRREMTELEDEYKTKRQKLEEEYSNEINTLQRKIEEEKALNRELNRKVSNLRTSQTAYNIHPSDDRQL